MSGDRLRAWDLTSPVSEAKVAERRFRVAPAGALCCLQRPADLDESSRRAFRELEAEPDVLVRYGLQRTKTSGRAFAQHHPILDVRVGALGSRGKLDHGVGLMRQTKAEGVDGDPKSRVSLRIFVEPYEAGTLTWQPRLFARRNRRSRRRT